MWYNPRTRLRSSEAIDKYGEIGDWHVSSVTDMSRLFENMRDFDENISSWDTSNVADMNRMFYDAPLFTQQPSWLRS